MAPLSTEQIKQKLSTIENWHFNGQGELQYDNKFKDFVEAISFVMKISQFAELLEHHPNILIHGYNKVKLTSTTHSEGGLTEKDFRLAEAINDYIKKSGL